MYALIPETLHRLKLVIKKKNKIKEQKSVKTVIRKEKIKIKKRVKTVNRVRVLI